MSGLLGKIDHFDPARVGRVVPVRRAIGRVLQGQWNCRGGKQGKKAGNFPVCRGTKSLQAVTKYFGTSETE